MFFKVHHEGNENIISNLGKCLQITCVKALIFGICKGLTTIIENEEYNYKVICRKKIWIDKLQHEKVSISLLREMQIKPWWDTNSDTAEWLYSGPY